VPAASHELKGGPESDGAHSQGTQKRRYRRWSEEDAKRWKEAFERGKSILEIAAADQVDPKIVSQWLHRVGAKVYQGRHRVEQRPLKIPTELVELLSKGPDHVLNFLDERVWGLSATPHGIQQLGKYCKFLEFHKNRIGVVATANAKDIDTDRTTIAEWREGTNQPYLVRAASTVVNKQFAPAWKSLPLRLDSGGNAQTGWTDVPTKIRQFSDIETVLAQLTPLPRTYELGSSFGLTPPQIREMKSDLLAYLLAVMTGDASKSGDAQSRFASMNIDLQLSKKQPTNERFGNFVCMCVNSLGIGIHRIADKQPTGATRYGRAPSPAYRWISERSPLFAWMFNVGLGLQWNQTTSYDQIHVEWIFSTPRSFRLRFIQGLSDSDATVKPSEVVITSVPNANLVTELLQSLGMTTAHTIREEGKELRTMVNRRQSATLPVFNEFVMSYRYHKMLGHKPN